MYVVFVVGALVIYYLETALSIACFCLEYSYFCGFVNIRVVQDYGKRRLWSALT